MNVRLDYIFTPETLISIVSTIVWVAVAWTSLRARVEQLEKDVKEIQWYELPIKIIELQKDVQYIRETLDRVLEQRN